MPTKMRLLSRAVTSVASFKLSRWPCQKSIALELDVTQKRMVASLDRATREPGEDVHAFCRRRRRHAGDLCRKHGLWSDFWFQRVLNWHEHLKRHVESHLHWILDWHGESWLQEQRMQFVPENSVLCRLYAFAGLAGTRANSGKVQPRWHEGVSYAQDNKSNASNCWIFTSRYQDWLHGHQSIGAFGNVGIPHGPENPIFF